MILVDKRIGSAELAPIIKSLGVPVDLTHLEYGDACFEGNGPNGSACFGFERKTTHDLLNCIDDARYVAHQRPGMLQLYSKSFLILEGMWAPGKPPNYAGCLLESRDGKTWFPLKYRSQHVMYSKLYRYVRSISLSGVVVDYTRNMYETAYNLVENFHYFQKKWANHTSLIEVQKLAIPDLRGKPTLVRRWAANIEGVGVKHSLEAEKLFKTPLRLAESQETDWLRIKGIGVLSSQQFIREIRGYKT